MPPIQSAFDQFSAMRTDLFEAFVPRYITQAFAQAIGPHKFNSGVTMSKPNRTPNKSLSTGRHLASSFGRMLVGASRSSSIASSKTAKVKRTFCANLSKQPRGCSNSGPNLDRLGEAVKSKKHLLPVDSTGHSGKKQMTYKMLFSGKGYPVGSIIATAETLWYDMVRFGVSTGSFTSTTINDGHVPSGVFGFIKHKRFL